MSLQTVWNKSENAEGGVISELNFALHTQIVRKYSLFKYICSPFFYSGNGLTNCYVKKTIYGLVHIFQRTEESFSMSSTQIWTHIQVNGCSLSGSISAFFLFLSLFFLYWSALNEGICFPSNNVLKQMQYCPENYQNDAQICIQSNLS